MRSSSLFGSPLFLGIGAQKAGTSWLHTCLKKHPDIWLPPEKELHYFDRSPNYPSPSLLHPDQPLLRFLGSDPWNQAYRARVRRLLTSQLHGGRQAWYLRYLLMPVNDRWYISLFKGSGTRIAGEITPSYAILDMPDVHRIGSLMPWLKVLFILRNPVERAWSQFRHNVKLKLATPDISLTRFREWVDSPEQTLRSNYLRTLSIWSDVFSQERIFVGFYDEIVSQPKMFLRKVLAFLGADSSNATLDSISSRNRVNVSPAIRIPDEFRAYLEGKYQRDIELLVQRFGPPIAHWLMKKQERQADDGVMFGNNA